MLSWRYCSHFMPSVAHALASPPGLSAALSLGAEPNNRVAGTAGHDPGVFNLTRISSRRQI
jgi:hypothetical protein